MPNTVQGTGNTDIFTKYVHLHTMALLPEAINTLCVERSKTLNNTDLGKAPSNFISGSLAFQGSPESATSTLL